MDSLKFNFFIPDNIFLYKLLLSDQSFVRKLNPIQDFVAISMLSINQTTLGDHLIFQTNYDSLCQRESQNKIRKTIRRHLSQLLASYNPSDVLLCANEIQTAIEKQVFSGELDLSTHYKRYCYSRFDLNLSAKESTLYSGVPFSKTDLWEKNLGFSKISWTFYKRYQRHQRKTMESTCDKA